MKRGAVVNHYGPLATLLVALAVVSLIVVPTLSTPEDATVVEVQALGRGEVPKGAVSDGTVSSNKYGYVIDAQSGGRASIPLKFSTRQDQRSILRLWAYGGPELETEVAIVGTGGRKRDLGRAKNWVGKPFDVTSSVRDGRARIEVTVSNRSSSPALFFDQAASAVGPEASVADSSTPLVALWVTLLIAAALQLRHQLSRHWFLPATAAFMVLLEWPAVLDRAPIALEGEAARLWEAARSAGTFSLHSGLVSGSYGELSALAVQAYHVLTALVGDGGAGVRAASLLASVATLCLLYALGNRAAGRIGAITVTVLALLADPFREAAASGTAVPVVIFAAAGFAYAIHMCLSEASRVTVGILGACGALAFLAESTWLFGIVLAIVFVALSYGAPGERRRVAGVGMLVLCLLILPSRISTADQAQGNLFADMTRRATLARNIEFPDQGNGEEIGLVPYLVDEHSPIVFVGGALTGANDALSAYGARDETRLAGLLAFMVGIIGSVYLLITPRLRLLVLLPLALAMPALFLASKEAASPFLAGAAVWPSFLVGGGVLAYAMKKLATSRSVRHSRG